MRVYGRLYEGDISPISYAKYFTITLHCSWLFLYLLL